MENIRKEEENININFYEGFPVINTLVKKNCEIFLHDHFTNSVAKTSVLVTGFRTYFKPFFC